MALEIDLSGRCAVVTGAGKGIGRDIALTLAGAGSNVFAVSRTESDLKSLSEEITMTGVQYASKTIDLQGRSSAEQVAFEAEAKLGKVDILINNAGVSIPATADEVTEDQWDETMDVNVKSAFFLSQVLGHEMVNSGWGRIINISSQAGLVALNQHAAYGASKAALDMITRVLAIEWGGMGVTVNSVAPTIILTPMAERVWGNPAKAKPMLNQIPIGRFGQPTEVSVVAAFLASEHASLINGTIIPVDGGYTAR